MLILEKFSGINNVQPSHRLAPDPKTGITPLVTATNVNIGLTGELSRRSGYSELLDTCHKNLHQADGFMLATVDGGDLTAMNAAGGNRVTLYPSLGVNRVWYCNLPDGRTTFSNGLIRGITDGLTAATWGVPAPSGLGSFTEVSGALYQGTYRYQLTHVRLSDGLEGGPVYSAPIEVSGGVLLMGLPVLSGHAINIYLTSHNDDACYYAGSTTGSAFSYIGKNDALTMPCRTDFIQPAPACTVMAAYGARVLVAVGPVLYASQPNAVEHFNIRRDFKQFTSAITLIQPVDDGVYVGTTTELAFLAGSEFDKLSYRQVASGPVVLGSGVSVDGRRIQGGQGSAMLCIQSGAIIAGFNGGNINSLTDGRYITGATEVSATFRMIDGIPQYVAAPQ